MALLRDIPLTLIALEERQLITCSTGSQTIVGSTANSIRSSVGDPSCSTSTGTMGRVIDRKYVPPGDGDDLTARYQVACPMAFIWSTTGSTETDRRVDLAVLLQHGDSSGGGDQVLYSSATVPAVWIRTFFSTARTSDMSAWSSVLSTGILRGNTLPTYYDLRAAKRFVSVAVFAVRHKVTTESSADEGARVSATITFAAGDEVKQIYDSTGALSTSTST